MHLREYRGGKDCCNKIWTIFVGPLFRVQREYLTKCKYGQNQLAACTHQKVIFSSSELQYKVGGAKCAKYDLNRTFEHLFFIKSAQGLG
jgi:hypothetical protein